MSSKNITGTFPADSFQLRYNIEGSGSNAIVIGSSIYYARTFSQNLRKHLRLIFMDHRGFASVSTQSPLDPKTFELNVLLDDIEHLRQHLNLGRITIIGHSGHGFMALEYAKKYPAHVAKVVLIAMGPDCSMASQAAADQYFADSVCPERKTILEKNLQRLPNELATQPEKSFITFCLRLGARSWYNFEFDASFLWENVEVNMQIIDYLWGTVFRDIDITKGLDNFNIPVFLALGQYDFLVAPFFTWNIIRSKFKDLTIRIFERSSHTPQYEEPDLFDTELLHSLSIS